MSAQFPILAESLPQYLQTQSLAIQTPSPESTQSYSLPGDVLVTQDATPTNTVDASATTPKSIASRYTLLRLIGEGGMGTVWFAEQTEPIKRPVAVKLIRTEKQHSKTIWIRFEAERQAIALMQHPHICKLFDAGTTESGAPYFVMEWVEGIPLQEFCDTHQLPIRTRIELLIQICGAIQHAHQKGIIHRDLKPSNILVEWQDHKPVPKVIDFGLAKATTGLPLTEESQDLERYLQDQPVLAGPPSRSYQLRKFYRRNRLQVIAASLVLIALFTGIAGTTIGLLRARTAEELAKRDAIQAKQDRDQVKKERDEKDKAREQELLARQAAQDRVVRLHLRTGRMALERNEGLQALHWYTAAWQADTNLERQPLHQQRIQLTLNQLPQLQAWKKIHPDRVDTTVAVILPQNKGPVPTTDVLTPEQAKARLGERVQVRFKVANANRSRDHHYFFLNSEKDYRSPSNFTLAIPNIDDQRHQELGLPTDAQAMIGRTIIAEGVVILYSGRSEIRLEDLSLWTIQE